MRAVVAVVALAVTVAACSAPAPSSRTLLAANDRPAAPAFRADLLDGGTFDLADHRGEVVVVNFWGSWCAPCHKEARDLDETYRATRDRRVEFVGVNIRDEKDAASRFVSARSLAYPMIFDPPGKVASAFDVAPAAVPSTILIDRDARIAMVIPGAVTRTYLEPLVNQLAAESHGG